MALGILWYHQETKVPDPQGDAAMSIQVTCPNGHVLRLKESFAGKTGYCPHCRAKVYVPAGNGFSEDDVINVLGPPPPMPIDEPETEDEDEEERYVFQDPEHTWSEGASGIGLAGSSILRHGKVCPACHAVTSFSFSICPRCGTPLPLTSWDSTIAAKDSSESPVRDTAKKPPTDAEYEEEESKEHLAVPKKSCAKCTREIDAGTRICPHCHTYIGGLSDLQGSRS
jgi:RNA polymerase subunit RPABC4/transcription elongation factor Spt4